MKQIKPILTTILLLLLLTSISYGWSPPNINSPVLLDETDEDPWGEGICYSSPSHCCYSNNEMPNGINMSVVISGIKVAISYIIFADMKVIPLGKFESDSILRENGNNNIQCTSQARGCE
jgi:hypothetical protein